MNEWAFGSVFRAISLTLYLSFSSLAAGQVTVKVKAPVQETEYSIEDESCRISWTTFQTTLNQHVIQQRSNCEIPLSKQLPLIEKLLVRVLEDKETASAFKTFYLGGLKAYPEMRERLAILAKHSPEWDLANGRSQSGAINAFLAKLANQKEFLAGWQDLFQRHGLRIDVSAIEKAEVSEAGRLSYFQRLEHDDIKATDKVPSDCLMWFGISRLE